MGTDDSLIWWRKIQIRGAYQASGAVHTTLEKSENGIFTLRKHQMFSVRTTPEEIGNQQSSTILDLGTTAQRNRTIIITYEKGAYCAFQ